MHAPDPTSTQLPATGLAARGLRVAADIAKGKKQGLAGLRGANRAPNPISRHERKSGWKALFGFAVVFAVVLLAAIAGANPPAPPSPSR